MMDRVPLAPAFCVTLLAGGLVAQSLADDRILLPAIAPGNRPSLEEIALLPAAPADMLLRRPIFAPNRSAAAPSGTAEAPAPSDVTLVGTAITRNSASALIKSSAGRVEGIRRGQAAFGWRLTAVRPGSAVLVRDGVARRLAVGQSSHQEGRQ